MGVAGAFGLAAGGFGHVFQVRRTEQVRWVKLLGIEDGGGDL